MSGLRKMHAKFHTSIFLKMLCLYIKFPNSPHFVGIKSTKSTTFVFFTEIDQNCIASLNCLPRVHLLAKLSDSNRRKYIFSFLTFRHFQPFNLTLKTWCCVKVLKIYSHFTQCKKRSLRPYQNACQIFLIQSIRKLSMMVYSFLCWPQNPCLRFPWHITECT